MTRRRPAASPGCMATALVTVVACAATTLLATATPASATVFSNTATITFPDPFCSGPKQMAASPFPSNISVSGLSGTVSDVNVTLFNVSHQLQSDIDVLVVGPAGENAMVVSDAGSGGATASNVTLTLDDEAEVVLPQTQWGAENSSVTYRPWDYEPANDTNTTVPPPAPIPAGVSALSTFDGTDANGTWSLYVMDDWCDNAGSIAGGWSLDVTTTSLSVTSSPNPSKTGESVTFTATVTSTSTDYPGTVTFVRPTTAGTIMVLASDVAVNGSGVATFTTSSLPEGSHLVRATYNDGTFTTRAFVDHRVDNNTTVTGTSYCNTGAIAIFDVTGPFARPSAMPYPSNIFVVGAPAQLVKVTATLKNITHGYDGDIEALLVGPAGQNVVVVSDAGDAGINNVTVNLDDAAASSLPQYGAWAPPGDTITVKPTNYDEEIADTYVAPAPEPSAATTLTTFDGSDPNGTWSLYVKDDGFPDSGSIAGGWCLNFTFDDPPPTVSIVQAAGQADPTQHSPINFTATFSEPVTGFTGSDVVFTGSTSGGTKVAAVTGSGTTYNVAVTGMTTSGTVVATIPAGGAVDVGGNGNTASSGGDNTVGWVLDTTKPTCSYTIVASPPPAHIDFTVQDVGSGIASITFPTLNNIVTPVPVPAFTAGTTSPISFTATKVNNSQRAQIAVVITDMAGVQASCI